MRLCIGRWRFPLATVFLFFSMFNNPSAEARMVFPQEIELIGELIFQNECSGKESGLLTWNEGEDFPSFGIGHFIWYPAGKKGPFQESFPMLLDFFERRGVKLPEWFASVPGKHAPWKTREEFLQAVRDGKLDFLRDFLVQTKITQTQFLIERFRQAIPEIFRATPQVSRKHLYRKLSLLLNAPGGLYPLVDYVNFNGEGLLETERYNGQGWGLFQALEQMKIPASGKDAVSAFVDAVQNILQRRIDNSPPERNEIRWLPGWKNRIRTYLTAQGPEGINGQPLRKEPGGSQHSVIAEKAELLNLDDILTPAVVGK